MRIEIDLEKLRKRNLMIATPAYGGQLTATYVRSLLGLQRLLMEQGIRHAVQFLYNESLVSRARNTLADMFLQGEYTDLIFIDADIQFEPVDVLTLMHFDREIIGGAYPLKDIKWDLVRRTLAKSPDASDEEISQSACRYSSHYLPDTGEISMNGEPSEVLELATGFMMIKRGVFDELAPTCPNYATNPTREDLTRERVTDYFQVGVHNDRYESEDYSFCRMWRDLGGKIFLCPWITLNHMGAYNFPGRIASAIDKLGELH